MKLWYKTIQWILLERIWNDWERMNREWNSWSGDGKRTRKHWLSGDKTTIIVDWTNWQEREVCRKGWDRLPRIKRT